MERLVVVAAVCLQGPQPVYASEDSEDIVVAMQLPSILFETLFIYAFFFFLIALILSILPCFAFAKPVTIDASKVEQNLVKELTTLERGCLSLRVDPM